MRTLIIIIALTLSSINLFSQVSTELGVENKKKRFLIKTSPTKPLIGAASLGLEYFIGDLSSIELEGAVRNLIQIGSSYDPNIYNSLSMRYKIFYKTPKLQERSNQFNGLYIAPGIKRGSGNIRFSDEKGLATSLTLDAGIMLTSTKDFTREVFAGFGAARSNYIFVDEYKYSLFGRLGVRIGINSI